MTAIIILNYNGFTDTIECLRSLSAVEYKDFVIVLVDNGSTDNSVEKISDFLKTSDFSVVSVSQRENLPLNIAPNSCVFYTLKENFGFAKGNNLGIELVSSLKPTHYLCLNNDTVVQPNFLTVLHNFQRENPQCKVLTPQIRYFADKEKIWNCGGKLFAGMRKYFYADKAFSEIKETEFLPITFVTGCALFVSADLVQNNRLFTEKFFFGEEDFEFSMRMKRRRTQMACVLQSLIYHKVGSSTNAVMSLNKCYVYYLNRFIDMRLTHSVFYMFFWTRFYRPYIRKVLKQRAIPSDKVDKFLKKLYAEYKILNGVSKSLFEEIMFNNYFLQ